MRPLSDLDVDTSSIYRHCTVYWILDYTFNVPCPPDNCLHTVRHSLWFELFRGNRTGRIHGTPYEI